MTAQMIRRFAVTGQYSETKLIQTRETINSLVNNIMREEGYVPLFDVSPVWATNYLGGEKYDFTYTMHGVFVGKETAWEIDGVMDGKLIPFTPRTK